MFLFDEICDLAKKKDIETLKKKIREEKICVDVKKGFYTPVMFLAQQGKEEAVTFLINEFNADRDYAVMGYAIGGHTNWVNDLLAKGANPKYEVRGYAQADIQIRSRRYWHRALI